MSRSPILTEKQQLPPPSGCRGMRSTANGYVEKPCCLPQCGLVVMGGVGVVVVVVVEAVVAGSSQGR